MKMQIKGILFDFDGTIANTIDLIIATFEHTCREVLGFTPEREKETLEQLKAQGIKLAVVTSKKPPMLRRGLDCLQLTPYFDATVALGDTKESKPHPEPMLAACAKLGVKPEECLCVGDSPFDLQSGRSAGAKTVAVRYTAFGWEKLLEEGRPDFVIASPQELLEIVGKAK